MPGGRPKQVTPPPRELTECNPADVAPLNKDGAPDMMNYMPTRHVPQDEATQRGWPCFFEAVPCRYGHVAPRYVSNPSVCVDCFRIKRGKTPIGQKAGGTAEYKPRAYTQREPTAAPGTAVAAIAPLEPDRHEKLFLAAYAGTKDVDAAARQASMTEAQVMARMSYSEVFRNAVNALEERLQIRRTPTPTGPFDWTDDKRKWLIEVYIDTGDIATARDAIRVTPSEYFRELERNIEFSDAILVATPLALNALEERAHQLALAGNDKLLQKILAAKRPGEYGERIKVDMSVTEKLTDAQLDAQLSRLIDKQRDRILEGEFTEVDVAQRQITDARNAEGAGSPQAAEPNSDLL